MRTKETGISPSSPLRPLPNLIFASRWLQLPLYLGLIVAQGVYVVHFLVELLHLVEAAFGSEAALKSLVTSIGYKTTAPITTLNETVIMLVVLALIDVVMISNLLIMAVSYTHLTLPSSASKMIATRSPRPASTWRSRQL